MNDRKPLLKVSDMVASYVFDVQDDVERFEGWVEEIRADFDGVDLSKVKSQDVYEHPLVKKAIKQLVANLVDQISSAPYAEFEGDDEDE